jgi:pilus assembly protein Flp/PilA
MDQGSGKVKVSVARFVKDQSGATAIEYGLIAAGIFVVIVVAVQAAGASLANLFGTVATMF